MSNSLLHKLQTDAAFNPWLKVARSWLRQLRYGPIDFSCWQNEVIRESIIKYEKGLPRKQKERERFILHLQYPPCPCVGTPEAPIWLMMKNPGISTWEEYDLLSEVSGKAAILNDEDYHGAVVRGDENRRLLARQELIARQLAFSFKKGHEFYALDEAFNTCERRGKKRRCCGAYDWYRSNLFLKNGKGFFTAAAGSCDPDVILSWCSKNLFILDYHPYRSKEFYKGHSQALKTPYWDELVRHAFVSNRMLNFWGSSLLEHVQHAVGKEIFIDAISNHRIVILTRLSTFAWAANFFRGVTPRDGAVCRESSRIASRNAV